MLWMECATWQWELVSCHICRVPASLSSPVRLSLSLSLSVLAHKPSFLYQSSSLRVLDLVMDHHKKYPCQT
jgi:hypothetical protein